MKPIAPAANAPRLAATQENSAGYAGWPVVIASAAGVLVSFASLLVYTFGVFLKPITAEFGWSREAASAAFGIAAMMVAVCSPPLGLLLDRYGPRRVILPSLVIFGGAFASLAALTPNILHLHATFFVLGMVGNGTAMMAYSRTVSTWFVARRGLALAILMAGGSLGAIVLPPLAQRLIGTLGWRGAFASLGALVLVVGLPAVGFFVKDRPGSRLRGSGPVEGATVAEGLRSRPFWILVVVLFLVSISQNASITHLAALLSDRGVSASSAAIAMSALGAASLVGRVFTGWLLDRFPAPRVSCVLLLLSAGGVLVLSSASTLAGGVVAGALIGFGMGGEGDVTPYLLARYYGLRSFSTLYGFTWTAYAIAGALGPVLMGKAFDLTRSYEVFLLELTALTAAAAGITLLLPVAEWTGSGSINGSSEESTLDLSSEVRETP